MAGEVLTCVDYRPASESGPAVCMQEAWMPAPTLLPVLSIADGALLGSGIVFLWGIAYGWNRLEKFVRGAR